MTTTQERRIKALLAALAVLKIEITTTRDDPDAAGKLVFSENVANRFDDGDAETPERYVLIAYDDERFADYNVWWYSTYRDLRMGIKAQGKDEFVFAADLDKGEIFRPHWTTTVTLVRRRDLRGRKALA
jgi:hypothetical protein